MVKDEFLKKISGVNNLKDVAFWRFILGLVFIIYGIFIWSIRLNERADFWTIVSLAVALFAIGLMFIFDGQSVLREYFRSNKETSMKNSKDPLVSLLILFFIIGCFLFFFKFYLLENPSLYPITIFLIFIILGIIIIIFRKDIISFKITKEGFEFKLGNRTSNLEKRIDDLTYEVDELKKLWWNLKITREKRKK